MSEQLYNDKNFSYFGHARTELIELIDKTPLKLLDVGCGAGATGFAVKQMFPDCEITGIELFPSAAALASERLDKVITGDIENIYLPFDEKYFDFILFADVLEHTKDPWSVLQNFRKFLKDDGKIIVSLPNIAFLKVLLKIIFDKFEYEEEGILDKTHLRFFTLHTIRKMLGDTGFKIEKINHNRVVGKKAFWLMKLTFGKALPFVTVQYLVRAVKS